MATPSEKSPALTKFLEETFGRTKAIVRNVCTFCGNQAEDHDFDDDLSRKEYTISGLCQICQNTVFGGGE